ncbi:YciI family protein [Chthoniobacter sp.]|uniref:YciI family protein n=1 Tax=Chthoniobacter sp. TaxID=2510640 RepID=UPI0032B02110
MRYMMIVKLTPESETGRDYEAGKPPTPELLAAMAKLQEDPAMARALLGTGELRPMGRGARVRASKGKLTVIDGPFIETKEVIGGYAILEAKSKEEALQMGQGYMQLHVNVLGPSYEAELEIREMADVPACGAGAAKNQP